MPLAPTQPLDVLPATATGSTAPAGSVSQSQSPSSPIPHSAFHIPHLNNPQSLAAVEALAAQAEQRLAGWFEANPAPPIDEIGTATQAIWRLTSVRKTMIQLSTSPTPKSSTPRHPAQRLFNTLLAEANQLQAEINKLSHGTADAPAPPPPSSSNPQSNNPKSNIPHLDIPQSAIRNSQSIKPQSTVPACPTLRAPLRTAQAALRQVNKLCGIPDDSGEERSSIPDPVTGCPDPLAHGACQKCARPFCPVRYCPSLDGLTCDGVCVHCQQSAACPVCPAEFRPNSTVP